MRPRRSVARRSKRPAWERTVDQIQAVRSLNNKRWMDIVRLAMRVAPKQARAIFREIEANDAKILKLSGKMDER